MGLYIMCRRVSGVYSRPRHSYYIFTCRVIYNRSRNYCQGCPGSGAKPETVKSENVKPWQQIPGPRSFPVIGTIYKYLPGGEYSSKDRTDGDWKKFQKYGEIVREEFMKGQVSVILNHPDDIEQIYRTEGKYPFRGDFPAAVKFFGDRNMPLDLLSSRDKEWADIRRPVSQVVMKPKLVAHYVQDQDLVAKDFVKLIEAKTQTSPSLLILPELYKYAMEAASIVLYNRRLGLMKPDLDPDSAKLIQSANAVLDGLYHSVFSWHLHKKGTTKIWKDYENGMEFLWEIGKKFIAEALQRDGVDTEKKSLARLLQIAGASEEEAILGVNSLLQGAIDTTGNTMCFLFYNLARFQDAQEKLFEQIQQLFPNKETPLSEENLKQIPYLRACIKESMRITPTATGNGRIMNEDIVVRNYKIPAGARIVLNNALVGRRSDFFRSPEKFIPERWMRGQGDKTHPYGAVQFSHGPRMCPGMRMAEQEMIMGTIRILQSFHISYTGPPVTINSKLLNEPSSPLTLTFTERQ